jgi:hypothetical protein
MPIDGLFVQNTRAGGTGVAGKSDTGDGLVGESGALDKSGVYGHNTGGGYGVAGRSTGGTGVYGTGSYGGFFAGGDTGVYAYATNTGSVAGYFNGEVHVSGYLYKSGGGFKIDHPLDPANKYLYHSFVESPDVKNIYDGVVTLDTKGERGAASTASGRARLPSSGSMATCWACYSSSA